MSLWGALVDEKRRRGCGNGRRIAPRMEEAGGDGSQQLRRAAGGGGHGDVLAWRRRVLLLTNWSVAALGHVPSPGWRLGQEEDM